MKDRSLQYTFLFFCVVAIPGLTAAQYVFNEADAEGKRAYLINTNQHLISLDDFEGKTVVVDFWYTGCGPCSFFYTHVLRNVRTRFRNQEDVVFVSLSADKSDSLWRKSIQSGQYTDTTMVNLYTGGRRFNHHAIQSLEISRFPSLIIIDKAGNVHKAIADTKRNTDSLYLYIKQHL